MLHTQSELIFALVLASLFRIRKANIIWFSYACLPGITHIGETFAENI